MAHRSPHRRTYPQGDSCHSIQSPGADRGQQCFTYSLYTWNPSFFESDIVREAYDLKVRPFSVRGNPSVADRSLFHMSAPNVFLDTVKPAEDGTGDVIVRLYEAKRTATTCTFSTTLPVKSAAVVNMLEEHRRDLELVNGSVALDLRPFEIITLRLTR